MSAVAAPRLARGPALARAPEPTPATVPAFFTALGARIEAAWEAKGRDAAAFPAIAAAMLAEAAPAEHFDLMDIVSWVHSADELPSQADIESKFSEPPVTLFLSKSKLFHISALHWIDSTTSIHQHSFSGAFHVLHGSSIHGNYTFAEKHRFGPHLMTGELTLKHVELLRRGDTRAILSGDGLIHSLFHLDRPSVTIVVRTVKDLPAKPQLDYAPPGLAFDPYHKPNVAVRSVQLLRLLHRMGHAELVPRAVALVARSNASTAYLVIDEMFRCLRAADRFTTFLEACRAHHPELVEILVPVYAQRRREYKIIGRREKVHAPQHRFLLALLMNVSRRSEVLRLVAERYPGERPAALVAMWVRELAATRLPGESGSVLGLELGDAELAVFEQLLAGLDVAAIGARLREEFDPADVDAALPGIDELCAAFRRSLLFRPLFTE